MKLLVTGDWHVDAVTLGISRHDDVRDAAHNMVEVAIDEQVDTFVFLGDLADPDGAGATLRAAALAIELAGKLSDEGIRSVWIAGNHDVTNDGTGMTTLSPLGAVADENIYVFEHSQWVILHGDLKKNPSDMLHLLCLPYELPRDVPSDLATMLKFVHRDDDRLAFASHLSLRGMIPGEETEEMPRGSEVYLPDEEYAKIPWVVGLSGHYHKRQVHECPSGLKIHLPGTLARFRFDEEKHEPGFLLLEV